MINLKAKILDFPKGVPKIPGFVVFSPSLSRKKTDALRVSRLVGAALDLNKKMALIRATSEAIERYCGFIFKINDFLYNSFKQIRLNAIHLDKFILYNKKQYDKNKYLRRFSGGKIHWVKGHEIESNVIRYIPASFVYPSSFRDNLKRFDNYTSSGLAASKNIKDAISNGLCETIERDSTMCSWLSKKKFIKISLKYFLDPGIAKLIKIIEYNKLQIETFIIPNDFDTVTMVAVLKSNNPPYYLFGSCCKLNPILAMQRAIEEAIMILRTQKMLIGNKFRKKTVTNLIDHIMVPQTKQYRLYIDSLVNKKIIDYNKFVKLINKHPKTLKKLLDKMSSAGYKSYFVDITSPDFKNTGFRIVRVIIPGLHPLETNHSALHLDLRRVSLFSGLKKIKKICQIPHPFG